MDGVRAETTRRNVIDTAQLTGAAVFSPHAYRPAGKITKNGGKMEMNPVAPS